jgi:hypothetical protein
VADSADQLRADIKELSTGLCDLRATFPKLVKWLFDNAIEYVRGCECDHETEYDKGVNGNFTVEENKGRKQNSAV